MTRFAKRNITLFFRDKANVFFSLLAVLITIGLYILFLGDVLLGGEISELPGAAAATTSWLAAGLMTTASLTTSLGAIGIMIDDKTRKTEKDFLSSPISRKSLTGGYLLSTFLVGIIMTLITYVLCEIYILSKGGALLPPIESLKTLGLILLSVLTSTSIVTFMVSFFKSQNAFTAASTVIGTLIGFITGVYIPIGVLPQGVQTVIQIFPLTHGASLLRQTLMSAPMAEMFNGAPPETIAKFQDEMGIILSFGNYKVTPYVSLLILSVTAVIFFLLALANMSRRRSD